MHRRAFVKNTFSTAAAMAVAGTATQVAATAVPAPDAKHSFQLKYGPHDGMFKNSAGEDVLDQLRFMADQGFTAFEDNGMMGRDKAQQEKMGQLMAKLGITMGVFVAHKIYWSEPNLASGKKDKREEFLADIRNAVEVAKRCNAKWMTVVPGHLDLRLDMGYQTANVVESLKRACDILAPHGLIMVLEPLNFRDHPGLFLTTIGQGYSVCKAVAHPSCKVLYDIYHAQIQHGNLIPNFEASWDEVAYIQIGDNPGRNEPTSGEINYKNVFKYIHKKGFTGVLGMEHGNAQPGKAGEMALIEAYKSVDSF
jgi:hydroxypyruvate isomerase